MSMPGIVPDPSEPCQDCDDDKFADLGEQDGGNAPASSIGGRPGRSDPPASDFDDDSAIATKRIVVADHLGIPVRELVRAILSSTIRR